MQTSVLLCDQYIYVISFFSAGAQNVIVSGAVFLLYWIIKVIIT
jgi:hypothetical protein